MKNTRGILCPSLNLVIIGRTEGFFIVRSEALNPTPIRIVACTITRAMVLLHCAFLHLYLRRIAPVNDVGYDRVQ